MKSIVVSDDVHKDISQLALNWGVSRKEAVKMILDEFKKIGRKVKQ